jgi:hypothetical protein
MFNGSKQNQPLWLPAQQVPQCAPKQTNFKLKGTTRSKAIAKTLANRSAYQILYVNVVIVNIVFKV